MPSIKRITTLALVGAALGFIIWSFVGQNAVSLMFGSVGGTFTCKADVEQGLAQFVMWQLYCAIAGAVLVPIVALLLKRKFRPATPSATPPAS